MVETTPAALGARDGWRYYTRLAANSFATMLDLGLFALGAALAGLGISLVLAGFDLVARETGLSTGSGLVTAMVLAVAGAFLMGIASEGPARRDNLVWVNNEWERAVARVVMSILVGMILIFVAGYLSPLVEDFPAPLMRGVELMNRTGVAGLWPVPLLGVPLAWLVRRFLPTDGIELELPVMFTVWIVALFVLA
ncbi:MAG TPA: hypothetical protein VJ815_07160 [Acidimicrobiia bacterium]|nr:hypothetical protein [Acidimicrobiia bacterium]